MCYSITMKQTQTQIGDGLPSIEEYTQYRDDLAKRAFDSDVIGWMTVELMCEAIRVDKIVRGES